MPWVIAIMVALTVIAAAGGLALNNLANGARSELAGGGDGADHGSRARTARCRQARDAMALLTTQPADRDRAHRARSGAGGFAGTVAGRWLSQRNGARSRADRSATAIRRDGNRSEAFARRCWRATCPKRGSTRSRAGCAPFSPPYNRCNGWRRAGRSAGRDQRRRPSGWRRAPRWAPTAKTIEIVHLLGGSDSQIARIFQRSIALDAGIGGVVGLALGFGAVAASGQPVRRARFRYGCGRRIATGRLVDHGVRYRWRVWGSPG